ncbi:hypothetical protein [Candidatus Lokiarchaeum ossiferum]|uniref:hypothetical protein n=1 Tax=Candidatus Lokiarchaeum ossiferum TaxID=2951803 RepID=UPI00352DE23E
MVNWTLFALNDLLTTFVMFVLFFVVLSSYIRTRYRHLAILSLLFFSVAIANLLFTIANLYLSYTIFAIFIIFMSIEVLFTNWFVDFVCRERVNTPKMVLWAFLAGMMIISAFDFENTFSLFEYTGGIVQISYKEGNLQILFSLMSLFWAGLLLFLTLRIYFEVPKHLKQTSFHALIATLVIIIRGIFTYQLNLISPFINTGLSIIGFGYLTYYFIKFPELAFMVPFKTLHLHILEIKSGMTIYSYNWRESNATPIVNDTLFSGLCTGLDAIFNATLQKGNIHEIHLEKAVLLLQREVNSPLLFIIISTKASKSLRKALKSFTKRFNKAFTQEIEEMEKGVINKAHFRKATGLLGDFFPFIPDYMHEIKKTANRKNFLVSLDEGN